MPTRWRMPSEKVPTRRSAASATPTSRSTSSTRDRASPAASAIHRRCARALRPGCMHRGSSSAPTVRSGDGRSRYARPATVTDPAVGASRPSVIRIVVDLPAPFAPRKPVTAPGATSNDRSSTASTAP
jgi:hypothetical protein